MLNVKNSSVMNLENALRGARNPMNSWDKSDSAYDAVGTYVLGENDLGLAARLCNAGSDHRKFIRQIMVSVDITAPLYWWKEYDTYKVGTVANSTSTMHKIHAKEFDRFDFSHEHMDIHALSLLDGLVDALNRYRELYNDGYRSVPGDSLLDSPPHDKRFWWQMIQLLPSSYNQMRTCTLDYEVLRNIYHARHTHKLDEWHILCDWIKTLPYADILIIGDERDTDE